MVSQDSLLVTLVRLVDRLPMAISAQKRERVLHHALVTFGNQFRNAGRIACGEDRDSIAREYVTDYDVTFRLAVPVLAWTRESGLGWPQAVLEAFLHVLAEVPDSLIVRKEGREVARGVSERAREVLEAGAAETPGRREAVLALDDELRGRKNRLNPGTTADLVAAALFVRLVEEL